MKSLMLCVVALFALTAVSTNVRAQTMGQTAKSMKAGQPQKNTMPRCTRARKMSGAPCIGG